MQRLCRTTGLGLALLLPWAAGCGDGRPERIPVSGRVLIDGRPLEVGFVQVLPKKNRPATGRLGAGGRFTLSTFDPNDGCVAGKHRLVVFPQKALNSTTTEWFAPKKYANPATSGLEIDLTGPRDDIEIKLTWEGSGHDGPFIERIAGDEKTR